MFGGNLFGKVIFFVKQLLLIGAVPKIENNFQARIFWERKKRRVRVFFAFSIIIFNLFGFELSTPHYSLTTEFANIILNNVNSISMFIDESIDKSTIFKATTNKSVQSAKGAVNNKEEFIESLKKIEFGNTIKIIGYGSFVLIFLFAFINADPFSKVHLLLDIIEEDKYKKSKKLPNVKDMATYAAMIPSNQLYYRCKECRHLDYCENSLLHNKHKRNVIWAKIFMELDIDFVYENLCLVNQCRKWHFIKYSLLFSSILLVLIYLGVRCSELFLQNLSVTYNWQLLTLIFLSLLFFIVLNEIDPSLKQLNDHLKIFYNSPQFQAQFKEKTCQREEIREIYDPVGSKISEKESAKDIYEREIRKLKMTIDYFTLMNNNRVDKLIANSEYDISRRPVIENILSYVVHMFHEIYKEGGRFSASLLLPEDEKLETWITESSNGDMNTEDAPILNSVDRDAIFSLTGSSIASKSWRNNRALSSNTNIIYLYKGQKEFLKSLISVPIECSNQLHLYVNQNDYQVDKIIGILCITSTNGSIFTRKRCEINTTMLKPFVSMIQYQYSMRAIERIKKGGLK
jgi:hypothetical protein